MRIPKVPTHLAKRFTPLSPAQERELAASLQSNYFPRRVWGEVELSSAQWLATPEGQRDLDDHTQRRLHVFRTQVVP